MLLQFLEKLGIEFELDWDDEVVISPPECGVSYEELESAIEPFGKRLADEVRYRAKQRRSVFVGGLLNGQEVGRYWLGYRRWIPNRVRRGRWEVYEEQRDGRAFFRGYATSERKAKRGELSTPVGANRGDTRELRNGTDG